MDKSRLETKVGLFVFIGLLLMAMLMVWFSKGASLFQQTYTVRMHASDVGGLKPKSSVMLAGVPVGTVEHIQLDPSGTNVTVYLQIYKKFPIRQDARFVIDMSGFLGDQYVSVVPTLNQQPPLTDGMDVECEAPFNLQEVERGAAGFVDRMNETAKRLDESVADLRSQVLNAQTLATVGATITNLRSVTEQALTTVEDVRGLIGTNSGHINDAVSNLVAFSAKLNDMGDSASNILATNAVNITVATDNIRLLTTDADQLLKDVQAGKGLAGTLVTDNQTLTNFQMVAENLSVTSSNLNRFGLWHLLWTHSPPATNGVTSTAH